MQFLVEVPSWGARLAFFISCVLIVVFGPRASYACAADHLARLNRQASFHISAGSLESALIEFSRQAEIQVVVSASVSNISVAAIEDRRNPCEVLIALL